MSQDAIDRYIDFFQGLSPASLGEVDHLFTADALFEDPFNRVRGPAAIRRIFEHLFDQHPCAVFKVREAMVQGDVAYLQWSFWPDPAKTLCIEGVSRVTLNGEGRISQHIDYWDSTSQLYARLPLIGGPARWLRRRLQADPGDQLDG